MDENRLNLPSFEEIKKGIDQILLIEKWNEYKIKENPKLFNEQFKKLFSEKLGLVPFVVQFLNSDDFPFRFYRLRKREKYMNTELISEYSHPPCSLSKLNQRANIPFHPVFYAADSPLTAIIETIKDDKSLTSQDDFYLSEWVLRKNEKIRVTPYLFGNIDKSSPYKKVSDNGILQLENTLKEYPKEQVKSFKEIMKFLSWLFIHENTYAVSSYIAHNHLYVNNTWRTEIFIYPSTQSEMKFVNFAIHPNVVSQKMSLNQVFRLNINKFDRKTGYCNISIKQVGENKDSTIIWRWVEDIIGKDKSKENEINNLFGFKM